MASLVKVENHEGVLLIRILCHSGRGRNFADLTFRGHKYSSLCSWWKLKPRYLFIRICKVRILRLVFPKTASNVAEGLSEYWPYFWAQERIHSSLGSQVTGLPCPCQKSLFVTVTHMEFLDPRPTYSFFFSFGKKPTHC